MEDPNEHVNNPHLSEDDQRRTLSLAQQHYPTLFSPPVTVPTAEDLMKFVLSGNIVAARNIYHKHPELLFAHVVATDLASGLDAHLQPVHRVINSTPLRAMAGGGDVWMLDDVWKSLPNHQQEIINEIQTQFPNGFEYPTATFDYTKLLNAINSDTHLIKHGTPNQKTLSKLAKFRAHFLPQQDTTNETIGYHFNINEYINAGKLFDMRCDRWKNPQLSLFYTHVIGFLQGLFSVTDAFVLLQNPQGIDMPGGERALNRNLTFGVYDYNAWVDQELLHSQQQLDQGLDCAIDPNKATEIRLGKRNINTGHYDEAKFSTFWKDQALFDRAPELVHGKDFAIDPNKGRARRLGEWDIHTGCFDEVNFSTLRDQKVDYLSRKVAKNYTCTIL